MDTSEPSAAAVSEPGLPSAVYTVSPDDSVIDVARLMVEGDVGDVIVAKDQKPVGILTDRDIVVRVLGAGLDAREVRVREVMSKPPVTISRNEEITAAIGLMSLHGIRRLPIVDENNRVVSILTLDDLILLGLDNQPELKEIVRQQLRPGEKPAPPPMMPAVAPSRPGASPERAEPTFSGPVVAAARSSVVIPMGRGHFHRRRRTWRSATGDWFYRNYLWLVIVPALSFLGVVAMLLLLYLWKVFLLLVFGPVRMPQP